MNIEGLLERSAKAEIVPLNELQDLASYPRTAGQDVVDAYRSQMQARMSKRKSMIDAAAQGGRVAEIDWLASERREIDTLQRDAESVLKLLHHVEHRTATGYRVPETQTFAPSTEPASPVLTREQSVGAWYAQRAGGRSDRGPAPRLGAVIRALALGNRQGLTEAEVRALSEGADAAGGYTVPEELSAAFIDRVRNAMAVMRAGAVTVPMQSETLSLARIGHPDSVSPNIQTAQWKTENDDIDETDIALERVRFTARTLPVLLKLSVELSEDSVNIDQIIERELSQQLAVELDRVALLGSGTPPEPQGIRNQSGVGVTALNAAPADWDFVVDAVGRCWGFNHEPTAIIWNASLATLTAKFKDQQDQPLRMPEAIANIPRFRTNQIPNSGVSPDETSMFVGDFSQLLIGIRTSFRLEVSRVAAQSFEKLQIAVRAYLRADVQLAHPEAFDVTTDVQGI